LESGLADLIDNSIDAGATKVRIRFTADRGRLRSIVVLDDGRGAARGTHDELARTSEIYREIYEHGLLERQFADAVEARGEMEDVA
jgi:DNA gyrase/topoisomerase IV subunit B